MNFARPRIYALGEPSRPTEAERDAARKRLCARIWRELGLVVLDPADIPDDWLRQAVRHEAERQFGGRNVRSQR